MYTNSFKSLLFNETGAIGLFRKRNLKEEIKKIPPQAEKIIASNYRELKGTKEYPQLLFTGLTENDLANLVEMRSLIEKNAMDIVEHFYTKVQVMPNLLEIIQKHSSIDRLKQTFVQYLLEMVTGEIGEKYVSRRKMVGHVHNRIGLLPQWYIGAYTILQNEILSVLMKEIDSSERIHDYFTSFQRLCSFDMQIGIETYIDSYTSSMMRMEEIKAFQSDLKDSAVTLAASVEETTSAIADKGHVVKQMFEEILEMRVSSKTLMDEAEEGKEEVSSTLSKIDKVVELISTTNALTLELSESSAHIGHVVNSIRGISKQTNILSLNAAIEAARAGEHGKGFSIVAQEVRQLARQTEVALDHIQGQIRTVQTTIEKFEQSFQQIVGEIDTYRFTNQNMIRIFEKSIDGVQITENKISAFSTYLEDFKKAFEDISVASQEISEMAEHLSEMNNQLADKF
ncbi:globin-coupled sensor protein [Bacillus sp. S/N-304-OC-R1]|uniref:globin-coupled sensor protein n=1 Tax=Bacillus sp. S/N-304-OC-R1 TaxID=2758034 RepID=UPI001C8ED886|nr:globin-coupled sensor protein [Bacillus sp. S/N-304-OC-R1]MBY0121174.1 globin-coupled sensor protein [Bacillus sp. S/N-304-OC-R1]